ncbi:hypothetical protein SAY86_006185 [Trapa natans]|uniref:Uncharacterized protein n=1 Tax=Trapa natans TaxID=22666 RepID=A0AAN7LDG9_TRANT|nr:hypothetical protein SAY86_006185 [Trapa natans]
MGLKFTKQEVDHEAEAYEQAVINYPVKNFFVRNLVSKKRRRLSVGGYDLDMSYITDRVLAMSFPAERMRAIRPQKHRRHPLHEFLPQEQKIDEKLSRLCRWHHVFLNIPAKILNLLQFSTWNSTPSFPVCVVYDLQAGKGRTGLMVCSYLVYGGMSSEDALQLYAQRRTTNNEGVSIPSQRRYVEYWASMLSFPAGGPPVVSLPLPQTRELRRIRLYDTVNADSVYFVVSELQEIPNQMYRPAIEVSRGCCRQIKKGYQRNNSPRYYLSFDGGADDATSPTSEPRLVVQMDTESPILYQKTCLHYHFDKPLQVTGDVRVIFYEKMNGGRLFYVCFNTASSERDCSW